MQQEQHNSLLFGPDDRHKDGEGFSFRQYLSYFGIVSNEEVQLHIDRVLRMEKATGLKMRLDWYDPYKKELT